MLRLVKGEGMIGEVGGEVLACTFAELKVKSNGMEQ